MKKRNIVLKVETYRRLEQYKVGLVKKEQNPKITYDDVVNNLLDDAVEEQQHEMKSNA